MLSEITYGDLFFIIIICIIILAMKRLGPGKLASHGSMAPIASGVVGGIESMPITSDSNCSISTNPANGEIMMNESMDISCNLFGTTSNSQFD